MGSRALLRTVVIVLTAAPSAGCSFLFVNGPPTGHEQLPYFSCTQSNTMPVLDAIWAGLNGLGAAVALSADESTLQDRNQTVAVGAAWLVVSGLSARTGFRRTNQCRAATMQLVQRQARRDTTPGIEAFWLMTNAEAVGGRRTGAPLVSYVRRPATMPPLPDTKPYPQWSQGMPSSHTSTVREDRR
jgi:hypothetical protein